MKIGIYSFEHPEHFYIGGAGDYVHALTEQIARLGHEIHLVVAGNDESTSETAAGVQLHTLPVGRLPVARAFQFQRQLSHALTRLDRRVGGFDVIHANNLVLLKGLSMPRVLTVHHVVATLPRTGLRGEGGSLMRRNERRAIAAADHVVTVSDGTREDLLRCYPDVDGAKVTAVLNGVPFDDYQFPEDELSATRRRTLADPDRLLIVAAPGRINDPRKGVADLLDALVRLSEHVDFEAVVLGGGETEPFAEWLNGPLKGRLVFPGFVDVELKRKLIAAADLFVLSSTLEGFGISLAEAMAAGRPVVATAVGGVPELVRDPKQGELVPPRDPAAMAEALRAMADDEARRAEAGRLNREFASAELSWRRSAERTVEVYRAVARQAQTPSASTSGG